MNRPGEGRTLSRSTLCLSNAAQVLRDGTRIRRGNGTGYADTVTDEVIRSHALASFEKGEWEDVIFCCAVLDLRRRERGGVHV